MPVKIPDALPAAAQLTHENVFVMTHQRAQMQDIRALHIAIMNLMPAKPVTETQLLRLLGNTPLQVDITLLHPAGRTSTHTASEHLQTFYRTFDEVLQSGEKFDGLIITGAPVETLEFEQVTYWEELKTLMQWAKSNVYSTLFICWAAQAGLYHYYGIPKYQLEHKMFGVFEHVVNLPQSPIARGFDEVFLAPHSRHTEVRREDVLRVPGLELVSESQQAGVYLVSSADGRQVFVTGHSEYDADSLLNEFVRDRDKGMEIALPHNYFPNNDASKPPRVTWRSHANLLFSNWLNYCVYQQTPYDLSAIGAMDRC